MWRQIREIKSLAKPQIELAQRIAQQYPTSSVVQEYWTAIQGLSTEIAEKKDTTESEMSESDNTPPPTA